MVAWFCCVSFPVFSVLWFDWFCFVSVLVFSVLRFDWCCLFVLFRYVFVCLFVCFCLFVCLFVCVLVCLCACVFVYFFWSGFGDLDWAEALRPEASARLSSAS